MIYTIPPHGYISKLAKLCKCNRATVNRALIGNGKGVKASLVREKYIDIYVKKIVAKISFYYFL